MNNHDRSLLWYAGALLVIVGLIIIGLGVYGLFILEVPCSAVGCPSNLVYWVEVFLGTGLVIAGAGTMTASRRF